RDASLDLLFADTGESAPVVETGNTGKTSKRRSRPAGIKSPKSKFRVADLPQDYLDEDLLAEGTKQCYRSILYQIEANPGLLQCVAQKRNEGAMYPDIANLCNHAF
ncbi:hypothetical protein RZS08_58170, partial [Arthrospira platensis SPKY1]|nr:hypothetical protein [Arthrospira platensis SPKY1]